MKLQTPVTDLPCKVGISYKDKIMMLGSCFSDNIGSRLKNYGFGVCINPFGTLYNPASILSAVRRLLGEECFCEEDCMEIGAGDSRTCSFFHHTSFARGTQSEFIENANASLAAAAEFFRKCNKVIITLGTSWCYRHIGKDMIVSNCLKRNPKEFIREFLPASRTAAILREIMELCPDKQFIFTVSPIRHFKDGAHGNQISKASLLLGIEEAIAATPVDLSMNPHYTADYFPAYEIVMDELRDYRFYAEDMCHPTQQTADYICERFLDWALPADEQDTLKENIRAFRHGCHIVK
jgi:hypothetical protein